LAGGSGTRLNPLTRIISKQLLPVYNKPMIYYPLSVLMLSKIKDILIISTPKDSNNFKQLLGNGKQLGINIKYAIQKKPKGIAEAFLIAENFIKKDNVCLILGDNIFYGQYFYESLFKAQNINNGATLFAYRVKDPSSYGVVEFDKNNNIISIEEKPKKPKTNYIATGLYFYDNTVVEKTKKIKPSKRGELEITSVNLLYLKEKRLHSVLLGRGFAWLDTGTHENLSLASEFVKTIENQQGFMIACIEEIAFRNNWITRKQLLILSKEYANTNYGEYLRIISNEKK